MKRDLKELVHVSWLLLMIILENRARRIIHWLCCRVLGILLLVFGLLLTPLVFAQQTLVYTGANMAETTETPSGTTSSTASIAGYLVLPQALNPNQSDQVVVPTSFNFGGAFYSTDVAQAQFTFTTVNGVITAWTITMNGSGGSALFSLSITTQGDSYSFDSWPNSCGFAINDCQLVSAGNSTPGVWNQVGLNPAAQPTGPTVAQLQAQLTASQAQANSLITQLSNANITKDAYINGYAGWASDAAVYKAANATCQAALAKK